MTRTTTATPRTEHSLYIKGIPLSTWQRARTNAITSGLPFRQFVIRLLSECEPYPVNGAGEAEAARAQQAEPVAAATAPAQAPSAASTTPRLAAASTGSEKH